jgi:hypothetical protein
VNLKEAKDVVAYLAKMFPGQLTDELVVHARNRLLGYDERAARKAIADHRDAHEFVTWPQLWEGCRVASVAEGPKKLDAQSWADVYRRQCPQLAQASDAEVALRVHRGWWFRGPKTEACRRQLETSCAAQLVSAGMTIDDAKTWTAAAFDGAPDYFRQCLEELRQPAAAEACPV